jgi:CubicO group peptidase (beta-lactamase class C family)
MPLNRLATAASIVFMASGVLAQNAARGAAINDYIQPYVRSSNFAGQVLVEKNGRVVFEKAYGFADREHHIANTKATQFHIASMSMQFTAVAILRLVDSGSIKLDQHVADFVPGIEGADKITIRDLLTERSGLPDINALPGYDDVLQHHQTPASLLKKIQGQPLLFEPGSKFLHEEHSAYNLLALIVEKSTGLPFRAAVKRLVFEPMALTTSGIDDDSLPHSTDMARGYEPEGEFGLKPAASIHWSAKTGNASVYTTATDEARWVNALFRGHQLSESSRAAVLDTSMRVGYGWFRGTNKRFSQTAYSMNGRAPGFASFVLYLPQSQTTIVVLSNIYSSATTTIGYDIAALSVGSPYEPFRFGAVAPDPDELKSSTGVFRFGSDFYQPNAKVALTTDGQGLFMHWPSGEVSALIPMAKDHYVDRAYWEDVVIQRDPSGNPDALLYDQFRGRVMSGKD